LHIASHGLRKSRTLLAVHISNLGLLPQQTQELRNALKINLVLSKKTIFEFKEDDRIRAAMVKNRVLKEFSKKTASNNCAYQYFKAGFDK
jgi:hypothetical protein